MKDSLWPICLMSKKRPSWIPHFMIPQTYTVLKPLRGAVAHDPRPRPVRSSPYNAERQSALAPPARFPCDQGRDRRGGAGTWRMAPPRVRRVNAHQTASIRTESERCACTALKVNAQRSFATFTCERCVCVWSVAFTSSIKKVDAVRLGSDERAQTNSRPPGCTLSL